ncbi:hypothetical protein HY68_09120 [Streptomyces sp. AcH 505]|nr:hypothetical protein HY68_09120 [Streptomyces sp. AcH 505]
MDMQQAADRADRMLDGTIGAIKPPVQWTHGPTTTGSCDLSRRRTVMTQISPNRRGALLGVIDRFWRKTGYEITSVNSDAEFPGIYARTVDGFQISLSIGGEGQAFFEVATPCVDASAVAESTVPPNGPAYTSGPIPRPNVQDDFWSSSEPLASSSPATP